MCSCFVCSFGQCFGENLSRCRCSLSQEGWEVSWRFAGRGIVHQLREKLGALLTLSSSSLPGSAKSRLPLLSERPGPEPGHPTCTQSCPQPPEPGAGTPDPQDHPYHEVSFPWEHPGSYQRQVCAVEEAPPERGSHCRSPPPLFGQKLIQQLLPSPNKSWKSLHRTCLCTGDPQ